VERRGSPGAHVEPAGLGLLVRQPGHDGAGLRPRRPTPVERRRGLDVRSNLCGSTARRQARLITGQTSLRKPTSQDLERDMVAEGNQIATAGQVRPAIGWST
jgi:hypothetical protein